MKKAVIVLLGVFVITQLFLIGLIFNNLRNFDMRSPSGSVVNTGSVNIVVDKPPQSVFIWSPLNTTYYFQKEDTFLIDLNVSASFEATSWTYTLEDLKHHRIVNESIPFIPNSTIVAVRWGNLLTVIASNDTLQNQKANVTFSVSIPNSAPMLENLSEFMYACEADSLSSYFNISDVDEDVLSPDVHPKNPFFVFPTSVPWPYTGVEIFSGILSKQNIGVHNLNISVNDGLYSDSQEVAVEVIEINELPVVENIGVQTFWTRGEGSSWNKQIHVSDVESGSESSGNFTFNLVFLNGSQLFTIDQFGVINFTANESHLGVHDVSLCVVDQKLETIHPNISLCGQDGGSNTVCQIFSVTVTDENRQPTIVDYTPVNSSIRVLSEENLHFNIITFDPDGTIPDIYWYVDNALVQYTPGESASGFSYSFGCGIAGEHNVSVEVTDGALNDSLAWNVSVGYVECHVPIIGGGGGGSLRELCVPKWGCEDWSTCQNVKISLEEGLLAGEDYRWMQDTCRIRGLDEKTCGFQSRGCVDANKCNESQIDKVELIPCAFIMDAGCADGIKNCHSGGCEILVDCGGPCAACPTCSDGVQNQGENGIDCGGPCPKECAQPKPIQQIPLQRNQINYLLLLIILILIVLVIWKMLRILKIRREIGGSGRGKKRYWRARNTKTLPYVVMTFFVIVFLAAASSAYLVETNVLSGGASGGCFPDYKCGEWDSCSEGLQNRTCVDVKCDNEPIIERKFCKEGCVPEISCGQWGACVYTEKTEDVLMGNIRFAGYKQRDCFDANECVEAFSEEENCEQDFPLEIKSIEECGKKYLAGIDPLSKRPIVKMDLDSLKADRLDIVFSQGEVKYCPACFNGKKDSNEEGIDCGGVCKKCKEEKSSFFIPVMVGSWLIFVIFAVLVGWELKHAPNSFEEPKKETVKGESMSRSQKKSMNFNSQKKIYIPK